MGLFQNVFKRKPGGTMFGNLLRGAVKNVPVVGSMLGNGAMMISQQDADKRDMTDANYIATYGVTKQNTPVHNGALLETVGAAVNGMVTGVQDLNAAGVDINGTPTSGAVKASIVGSSKTIIYLLVAAAVCLVGYFVIKKK